YRGRLRPPAHYALGWLPLWARLAGFVPRVVNRVMASPLAPLLKRLGGIAEERALPRFAVRSFSRRRGDGVVSSGGRAALGTAAAAGFDAPAAAARPNAGPEARTWSASALWELTG